MQPSKEQASPDPRLLLAEAALDAFERRLASVTKRIATALAIVAATALFMGVYGLRHMDEPSATVASTYSLTKLSSNGTGVPSVTR
jgi:hypothetical protein